eukprot:TRINITY_DN20_c0_g1_i3.p1 TRINITY_DN20_c0_g1~~TRINITY_DN20_c0_g1_i3.p1  ORF type:complete len:588 (+),score=140.54 TRINITY_DN20_c0_g1_i3:80-1765(+)
MASVVEPPGDASVDEGAKCVPGADADEETGRAFVLWWLRGHEMSQTIATMERESARKADASLKSARSKTKAELINLFEMGESEKFFPLFQQHTGQQHDQRPQNQLRNLDFSLHLYFALFPLHPSTKGRNMVGTTETMDAFKRFLERHGSADLNPDFLAYFALPYVPNPEKHPSFAPLFQDSWVTQLRRQLESFLCDMFQLSGEDNNNMANHLDDTEAVTAVLVPLLDAEFSGVPVPHARLVDIYQQVKRMLPNDYNPPKLTAVRTSLGSTSRSAFSRTTAAQVPLDYRKIIGDLLVQPDSVRCQLLLALNARICNARSSEQRSAIIDTFTLNDLLGLNMKKSVLAGLLGKNASPQVKEATIRLMNSITSSWAGRDYFVAAAAVAVPLALDVMRCEKGDTRCRQQALAALQKLSLRRAAQSVMIELRVVEWLLGLLQHHATLCPYTLEYATALLLNLSLRKAGRERCEASQVDALQLMKSLLTSDDTQVRLYTNGVLYSLLERPRLRARAQQTGLRDTLSRLLSSRRTEIVDKQQFEYLLRQMDSRVHNAAAKLEPRSTTHS